MVISQKLDEVGVGTIVLTTMFLLLMILLPCVMNTTLT
jgi:hypothetical protein